MVVLLTLSFVRLGAVTTQLLRLFECLVAELALELLLFECGVITLHLSWYILGNCATLSFLPSLTFRFWFTLTIFLYHLDNFLYSHFASVIFASFLYVNCLSVLNQKWILGWGWNTLDKRQVIGWCLFLSCSIRVWGKLNIIIYQFTIKRKFCLSIFCDIHLSLMTVKEFVKNSLTFDFNAMRFLAVYLLNLKPWLHALIQSFSPNI